MSYTKILLPILIVLGVASQVAFAAEEFAPITLEGSQMRPFSSRINDRPYQLYISFPESYSENTDKKYPVLYVTDGYWDVKLIASHYGNMIYDKTIPELIVVGIGYSDPTLDPGNERLYDMTPYEMVKNRPENAGPSMGGGEDFLKIIKQEIIPYVDENLRTDTSYRVFGGSSLGGFYTLYTLFMDPELFDAYIAISPGVTMGERWLYGVEYRYRLHGFQVRNHSSLPARLFMSAAEKEWTGFRGDILGFDQILKHGGYVDFEYHFMVIKDEKHSGTKAEGYSRGIRYAFKPYLEQLNRSEASANN